MMKTLGLIITACMLTGIFSATNSANANELSPEKINVFPAEINLNSLRDSQSIVVQAVFADGVTVDITKQAKIQLADPKLVQLKDGTFLPAADGKTIAKVEYGTHSIDIPVSVEAAKTERPISFQQDVMPIFMRSGCNTGSCHGAKRGKDGFRLSLFGFDQASDYQNITREMGGRRINLALPKECLLIEKATGAVPHSGGAKMKIDDEYYETVLRWLEAGAKPDPGPVPSVESIEIYPLDGVFNGPGSTQQLTVRAKYSDGTDRDVTSLASFSSNNDNSASVSPDGLITAAKRGEAFVMARFDTHTIGSHFIVLPKDFQFKWNNTEEYNYIDKLMNDKFRKLRILPSELATDEEYLRRVYLDICGTLPNVEEYNRFLNSKAPNKRELLVDELLDRKEFVEIWVMKWSELLRVRSSRRVSYKSMLRYYDWLKERISNNVPVDQMTRELLSANGGTFANAATNYYQDETDTLKVSENVAQVFMGMRIQCAQCHNHPFDRWTMDDYYSFAAFFSQIGRKRGEDPRETIVYNRRSGEVKNPVGGKTMAPKFLGGETPELKGRDRREVMADWLASSENPFFARNLSNIVWNHFFGRGIVEPVDDVRVTNPAVNPELLDALSEKFTSYDYDFKKLVRDICTSRTYQLSTKTNETNETDLVNFSHASLRRVRAEVLLDAISIVTNTQNKFRGLPIGARAVQIADGTTSTYFLTTFGRATRETVCSCEVKVEPNLSQALHLMNGSTVQSKITQGKVVQDAIAADKGTSEVIEEIYIRCLTRKPTETEMKNLSELVDSQSNQRQALEDVFWAVLNSREFVFNH